MQRTIYVKAIDWELIKREAEKRDRSISNYLVMLHREVTNHETLGIDELMDLSHEEMVKRDGFQGSGIKFKKGHRDLAKDLKSAGNRTGKTKSFAIELGLPDIDERDDVPEEKVDPYFRPKPKGKK